MATISEISDLDSGVASPETSPEGQDPLRKSPEDNTSKSTLVNSKENSKPQNTEKSNEIVSSIDQDQKLAMISQTNDAGIDSEDDDDQNIDESLAERLWGLTEMFPSSLRSVTSSVTQNTVSFIKGSYQLTRQVIWIGVSSSLLLFAPVMFEVERFNVEEMMKQDRNRLVLGPGSAMSGPPNAPGLAPVPTR